MTTLLTFVDVTDPFGSGLVGEEPWLGPTLTLLSSRSFERVVLLVDSERARAAEATCAEIGRRFPGIPVVVADIPDADLAGLSSLVIRLRAEAARWTEQVGETAVASVGAGHALARAAWLVVGSMNMARFGLVDVEPRRYATDRAPRVTDVKLAGPSEMWRERSVKEPAVSYHAETERPGAAVRLQGAAAAPDLAGALRRLGLCGTHPLFRKAVETAAAVAPHKAPVLIQGETGTGKGLMAQLIHTLSGRDPATFIAVNCAALPEQLVESILFGHRKGAFTGAAADQRGKFELADGGTIFLDEVGELPLALQPKLLKVLEDGMVEAIGASRGRRIDARVVAATNRDLQQAVVSKTFREDLYYRLSFARIELPALRERRSDIHHLALLILAGVNVSLRAPRRLSPSAIRRLEQHEWPGNVRDLENVIGRSILLSNRDVLEAEDLLIEEAAAVPDPLMNLPVPRAGFSMEDFLEQARRQLILRALDLAGGSQSGAARLLGVTPQAIHQFVRETVPPVPSSTQPV